MPVGYRHEGAAPGWVVESVATRASVLVAYYHLSDSFEFPGSAEEKTLDFVPGIRVEVLDVAHVDIEDRVGDVVFPATVNSYREYRFDKVGCYPVVVGVLRKFFVVFYDISNRAR